METVKIESRKRTETGKGYARKLRKTGMIPAVLHKDHVGAPIEVDPKLLSKAWQNERRCSLNIDGELTEVSIAEIQLDAAKRKPLHADFVVQSV